MGEFFDDKVENFIRYMLGGYATNKIGEAKKNWEQWKEENTIQEIVVIAEDFLPSTDDSECTCRACVMCTKATKGSEPVHIKKKDALIHIGDIGSLDETDIEMDGVFAGCTVGGTCLVSKEYIQGGVWQEPNEKSDYGENRRTLSWINSYMICERYENGVGVIYFHDDGQDTAEISQYMEDNGICILPVENREKQVAFLNLILREAVKEEMESNIPWQVTLGQAAQETGWGDKLPIDIYSGMDSNNIFGIKYAGEPSDNPDLFVRAWTKEYIDDKDLNYWEKEHNRWALEGETIKNTGVRDEKGKLVIEVIQPFRTFSSKYDSIIEHSEILNNSGYYAEAEKYQDDPYKYIECIAPVYASGSNYSDSVKSHINKYMDWNGKDDLKP